MAALDFKQPPPCPPGKHSLHPHSHVKVDGTWKPCSGRWFCQKCWTWHSGKQCDLPGAPKLPAGWLR